LNDPAFVISFKAAGDTWDVVLKNVNSTKNSSRNGATTLRNKKHLVKNNPITKRLESMFQ